jgi:protease I
MNELKNFRVAVLATDGVEETELTEPVRALRAAGADVDILSLKTGEIQAYKSHEKGARIEVSYALSDVKSSDYDGLVLPGGALNADRMRAEEKVLDFVREMDQEGKPIASICHAPWILISAGLVEDRMLTSYYTIQDDLKNAGADWVDQQAVLDRNWVSSREPKDIPAFNREVLKLFSRSAQARSLAA